MSERLPSQFDPTDYPFEEWALEGEGSTIAGALLIVCLVMVPLMALVAWVLF